jgi:solute carrier family 25 oxoglutarate transporter 11
MVSTMVNIQGGAGAAAAPSSFLNTADTAMRFATGGLGGILAWVVVHPANTLAVQMTLQSASLPPGASKQSFFAFSKSVIEQRGFGSLYDGLSAGCTRQIFYATSRLGLFEVFRDLLVVLSTRAGQPPVAIAGRQEHPALSSGMPVVTPQVRVMAGLLSGGLAALVSCPAEVCLVRMSNDQTLPADQRRNYTSVLDAAVRISKEEGVGAFWRGSGAFVQRAMVVGVCQVGAFDQLKDFYASKVNLLKGTIGNVFAAAMTSGLLYSAITMPLETAKNRMAFQKKDPATGQLPYRSTLQTVRAVTAAESPMALWAGFLPYYVRCGGHTVCMFIAVDAIRKAIK